MSLRAAQKCVRMLINVLHCVFNGVMLLFFFKWPLLQRLLL